MKPSRAMLQGASLLVPLLAPVMGSVISFVAGALASPLTGPLLGLAPALLFSASAEARSRFEPPDGKTLLIIGQEQDEIAHYWKEVGPASGYMLYANLDTLAALRAPWRGEKCADSGTHSLQDWARNYPDTVVQIGLYMVGHTDDVLHGELDDYIEEMAELLRRTKKPVFLRVGYEVDAGWNRFKPTDFVPAYQRIARILRGQSADGRRKPIAPVDNVALVWHSAAYRTFLDQPFSAWYPGDEYVDWIAISSFPWKVAEENKVSDAAAEAIASFANAHGKPLMIAESAPKQYFQPDHADAWEGWYAKQLAWIERHNVKAFSYINQNWNLQPMWGNPACGGGGDWGDTRVQMPGNTVLEKWKAATDSPRFLKQGPALFTSIGFTP